MKSDSEIAQSCPTLRDPMDSSLPGSSSMGFSSKSNGVGCHCLLQRLWFNQGQITSVNLLLAVETEVYTEAQSEKFCA